MNKKRLWIGTIFFLVVLGTGIGFYFCKTPVPIYTTVPVYDHSSGFPVVEVEIESHKFRASLDTGAEQYLSLRKEALDQLQNKEEDGIGLMCDIHGNEHEVLKFVIPKIKISGFQGYPVPVDEENLQCMIEGSIGKKGPEVFQRLWGGIDGQIGIKIFAQFPFLLDLPRKVMYIALEDRALLKAVGLSRKDFVAVPLVPHNSEVVVLIETDRGPKKVLLDTACECSIWSEKAPPDTFLTVEHLRIGGFDFGSQKFLKFPLPASFGIDAILGIDFLKKRRILIDLKNKKAFFGRQLV